MTVTASPAGYLTTIFVLIDEHQSRERKLPTQQVANCILTIGARQVSRTIKVDCVRHVFRHAKVHCHAPSARRPSAPRPLITHLPLVLLPTRDTVACGPD